MKFFSFLCFLFGLLLNCPANAQELLFENNKLLLSLETKKTDNVFQILSQFTLKDGWHISYENPGDAGVPTMFEMNVDFEQISSSVPSKFMYDDIVTQYGYGDQAYYLLETKNLKNKIKFHVSWTACRDYCEPEEAFFEIPLVTTQNFEKFYQKALQTFPQKRDLKANAEIKGEKLLINAKIPNDFFLKGSYFIPKEKDLIRADSPQKVTIGNHVLHIEIEEEGLYKIPTSGLITDGKKAYLIEIEQKRPSIFWILMVSFFAGLILNLMPCVLPVLSLKALNLVQIKRYKNRVKNALSYMLGVLFSFFLIAGILYFLKKSGESFGWGFQLQSPAFIIVMIVVFFFILLYLMGFLKFKIPFLNAAYRFSGINTFLTGFFAVLIASPCTGPFMGAAVGYALFENPHTYFPIFLSLGFGYGLPFALLELFPKTVRKMLPKPGKWMEKVKYVLALPIFLTIIWLLWVLAYQLYFKTSNQVWKNYDEKILEQALEEGRPVLIDFTAKWCLTCLINEQTSLSSEAFLNSAKQKNVLLLKADWTTRDPKIFDALKKYERGSVPLYVFYPEDNENYIILPQILTEDSVLSILNGQ